MRKMSRPLVASLLASAAMIAAPRMSATPRQETLSNDKSIFLMRLILGLEHETSDRTTYLNLVDLLRTPGWPNAADRQQDGLPDIHVIDSSTGEALKYVVQVTTSDDRKHFQASLEPVDPKTCAQSFFTDDRGVIYVGKGLGCR